MPNSRIVYFTHCVDTEGPLYESLNATASRIFNIFGLSVNLTPEKLERLRQGLDVPPEMATHIQDFVSRINYKESWAEVDEMLDEILSDKWRAKYRDDAGRGYIFNWFILDHVGFETNPRRRALGYHQIYEHYRSRLCQLPATNDRLYWHFHPVSYFREAHKTSGSYSYTNEHLNVLSRRIIDYLDFPVAFRPGSHVERPDINLFLELWIPFDYGNQGMPERWEDSIQNDLSDGRYGDWRRATSEWEVYNPDLYDYQKKGGLKRYIARCLNLDSRVRPITTEEIEKAFIRASSGLPTILSVTSHDEREMRPAIDWLMSEVSKVRKKFPEVRFLHANAVEAIRSAVGMRKQKPVNFSFRWERNRLLIDADAPIWGPQPYFCFKTKSLAYIHENLDRILDRPNSWSFTFDDDTVCLDQLTFIGIASHDAVGNTTVCRLTSDKDLSATQIAVSNSVDWIK